MPRLDDVTPIGDVAVTSRIQEGKLEIEASTATDLHISTPDPAPLGRTEPHATLFASTEDTRVEITLDAVQAARLAEQLPDTGGLSSGGEASDE